MSSERLSQTEYSPLLPEGLESLKLSLCKATAELAFSKDAKDTQLMQDFYDAFTFRADPILGLPESGNLMPAPGLEMAIMGALEAPFETLPQDDQGVPSIDNSSRLLSKENAELATSEQLEQFPMEFRIDVLKAVSNLDDLALRIVSRRAHVRNLRLHNEQDCKKYIESALSCYISTARLLLD